MVLGYYGDKYGRKISLSISVLLMAVSTCLIGCLPTYSYIGVFASVLLTVCRLIQGFAIGGEFTISVTYMIEHAPIKKRGFYGSLTMLGNFLGLLLGSFTIAALEGIISSAELLDYGWRIPFVLSLFLGIIGLFMRIKLPETPDFITLSENKIIAENPILLTVRKYYLNLFIAIGIVCLGAASFTLWFVWLPSYLKLHSTIAASKILLANSLNLLAIIILIPIIGLLSDKFGKKIILSIAALGTMILVMPLLMLMNQFTFIAVYLSQLGLAILASCAYGVVPITLFELFPAQVRCSGVSASYNIANMLFGGTIPLLASLILLKTSNMMYQGMIIVLAAAIMLSLLSKVSIEEIGAG